MNLIIYTDGGALNNPGPAASAFAMYEGKDLLISKTFSLGNTTNNVAEYTAVLRALEEVVVVSSKQTIESISFFADSQLVVRQLGGVYKIKDHNLRSIADKIKALEMQIAKPITYTHVPREQNTFVDSLVKKTLGR